MDVCGHFLFPADLPAGNIRRYSLNKRLHRPCSPVGLFEEEKKCLDLSGIELRFLDYSDRIIVTTPTEKSNSLKILSLPVLI